MFFVVKPVRICKTAVDCARLFATSFIFVTNFSTLPDVFIASATAQSLPLRSISPYNKSRYEILSPGLKYTLLPSIPTAADGTNISSSRSKTSSITVIALNIFVVLAMGSFACPLLLFMIFPLLKSMTAYALVCLARETLFQAFCTNLQK